MPDQYTRTRAQLGTPALDVLRRAHVAVFGIGGVGGQAVEVLARSGVGELSLFDSDTVALSNLNRQLVALHSTLGQYKVDAMAARIADIDPTIIVHANRMFYNAETAPDVDLMQFDLRAGLHRYGQRQAAADPLLQKGRGADSVQHGRGQQAGPDGVPRGRH